MRICMLTSAPMPPVEGIGYYIWNLSRFLVEQGCQVQIVTRGQRGELARDELAGIPIWRPRFFHSRKRLVRQLEPEVDVFHLHTPLPLAIRSKRPTMTTVHTSTVGAASKVPVVDLDSLLARCQAPGSIRVERRIFANADRIVTVARSVAAELQNSIHYKLEEKPVGVLGSGVDTDVFCANGQGSSAWPGEMYILSAGRLDAKSGVRDLIEAMGIVVEWFPDVHLYIAGSGPLERRLKAQVKQMSLGHAVRFLGRVETQTNMIELYRGAMVFAHAAHYQGLPTVLLEAMACEKAVVSTAVSGALDVVIDGLNGFLTTPKSSHQLAGAVCRLLSDAGLRARFGKMARHTVQNRFSWRVVGDNYLRNYQTLLNGAKF